MPAIEMERNDEMAYHAQNGIEFVGLRRKSGVGKQIVYDAASGRRILLNILDQTTTDTLIDEALREGIASTNVLNGVLTALQARFIKTDYMTERETVADATEPHKASRPVEISRPLRSFHPINA